MFIKNKNNMKYLIKFFESFGNSEIKEETYSNTVYKYDKDLKEKFIEEMLASRPELSNIEKLFKKQKHQIEYASLDNYLNLFIPNDIHRNSTLFFNKMIGDSNSIINIGGTRRRRRKRK